MNKKFKATQGPWEVKHSESKDAWNVVGTALGGKYKIARCPYVKHDTVFTPDNFNLFQKERAEAEANAKLIACAPEMLGLLEILLDNIDWTGNVHMLNKVNDLIQKATI